MSKEIMLKNNFQKILVERGISIQKVQKATGLNYYGLCKFYKQNMKLIPADMIYQVCKFLQITPNELFLIEK